MKHFAVIAALAFAALASPALLSVAAAQDVAPVGPVAPGSPVWVPWGAAVEWLIATGVAALGGAAGIAAWLLRRVPSQFRWLLTAIRVDQLLQNAINDGVNRTLGAARGKSVTLDTGLAIANEALRYAVQAAPRLVEELGVLDVWRKILARIDFDGDVVVPASASPNLTDPAFARLVK